MTIPGLGHPITLETDQRRWRAYFNNHVIADTDDALILREAGLAPVVYFPRRDVSLEYMGRTGHRTHCPAKGDAAYYTLTMDGEIAENVAWSYETPFDAVSPIRERIAFYADRVEVHAVDDAAVNPRRRAPGDELMARSEIDEIVQHTDAGGGVSQREHWAPNVSIPDAGDSQLR